MRTIPLQSWHQARGAVFAPARDEIPPEPLHYGDAAAEWASVRDAAGLFDATAARERLLVTGADRIELLDGLTTNALAALPVGAAFDTAFITPKGRLVADARLVRLEDGLLLDVETGRAAPLSDFVASYRIHEDAPVADVSAPLAQLQLWGPRTAQALGLEGLEPGGSRPVEAGGLTFAAVRTAFGVDAYVPAPMAAAAADALTARARGVGGGPVGRAAVEVARLSLGIGRFGPDWDERTNPLEAGLEGALSYSKGCYVGQEVVAKATYIGHVARRLVRLEWEGAPAAPGTPLLGGRAPGRVTSCAAVPGTARVVALGYVRRDASAAGTVHRVGEGGPEARVTGLPLLAKAGDKC